MTSLTTDRSSTNVLKKGKAHVPHIQGTRQSVKSAQILTSSGIPSLDHIIGGSLPVGTILLIEEDTYGTFAKLMIKYFLAEGAANNHVVFLGSRDFDPRSFVKQLPRSVQISTGTDTTQETSTTKDDSMTIAWRYQNMRQVQSAPGSSNTQLGHNFDLTSTLSEEEIQQCESILWSGMEETAESIGGFRNHLYGNLLKAVQQQISQRQLGVNDEPQKHNVLRVALHSLGSPGWISASCLEPNSSDVLHDLPRFLMFLRSLLRESYAVACVTIPSHLFQDRSIEEHCEYQSDYALHLESFAGSSYETNAAFKEYHGILHIKKLGFVNTLAAYVPESLDLAFKLKRKKFVIEKLHLPPELQESVQREQDDIANTSIQSSSFTCSAGLGSSKLDF